MQSRPTYLVVSYAEIGDQLAPYMEDLGEVAAIEELELVNLVLYLFTKYQGEITDTVLSNEVNEYMMGIISSRRIYPEDFDQLTSAAYEAIEVMTEHLHGILRRLGLSQELTAINLVHGDLILTQQDTANALYRVTGMGVAPYPGGLGQLFP